jgi:protein transport protein SEC61 subunit gamma and related proteins
MEEEIKKSYWKTFKEFCLECKRVLKVTKKPSKFEFQTIVKVSALGMTIVGVIGFILHLVKEILL